LEITEQSELPQIDVTVQAVGIQSASVHWYNKITEQRGKSHERQRFVNYLGILFREELINDMPMSYPGHNGFSLQEEELAEDAWLFRFLNDAVDYGDLFDAPHTTKSRDRKPRRKWYLNPILSPKFQIPETHVKEPKYISVHHVREWLVKAGVLEATDFKPPLRRKLKGIRPEQLSLMLDPGEKKA
jgi:hypothetical protein